MSPPLHTALFRFYEELNFFLPEERRKRDFDYVFKGNPSIKDAIEALGVPHTEVEIILVNGLSVGFDYRLQQGDRVSVYPMFESLDVSPLVKLRQKPMRDPRFICDVHLGKLATILRLLGFDTLYQNNFVDDEIIAIAVKEHRIIFTCDRGILKNSAVTHGCCLRSRRALEQVEEVIRRFDLSSLAKPFSRCTVCNGVIELTEKEAVMNELPKRVARLYESFYRCADCRRIYWQGDHYLHMMNKVKELLRSCSAETAKSPTYQ
jgi:uncharacterized protein